MSEQREYWFKIEGKIYAEDEDDAYKQLHAMAIAGTNCAMAFYLVEEAK